MPVVLAVLLGFILGRYIFGTYRDNLYRELSSSRLYLIEKGEYDSLDEMREDNSGNNYVYYKDDDKYKTVVGITREYDNISKIKSLYSDNLQVMEYFIASNELNELQGEYDRELLKIDDSSKVREVVDSILELYRESNDIRLIKG